MKINNNDENHNSSYGDLFSQNSEDSNSFDFNTLEDSLNEVLNENTKSEHDISLTTDQSSEKTKSSQISELKNNENILDNDMESENELTLEGETDSTLLNNVVDNNFDDSELSKDDHESDNIEGLSTDNILESYNDEDFDVNEDSPFENFRNNFEQNEREEINISQHSSPNHLSQSVKIYETDSSQQENHNIDVTSDILEKEHLSTENKKESNGIKSNYDNNIDSIDFSLPKNISSVIKVIGIGGGGSNAVNHMISEGIKGVDFVICNTDAQALEKGQAATKVQLGMTLTEGLGAGENPSVGEQAALESEKEIRGILKNNTKMVFVTAGMGGGTGTGAAPVIAKICKDLDILTIGIVTVPFEFEGPKRYNQAKEGIDKMRKYVDSLVVINNDKLVEVYGNLGLRSGFAKADETLMVAARGISEVITKNCLVNIDLNDAKTVLKDSGTAIMGYGKASGENRAQLALEMALDSPLLNDNHIRGANKILLLILSGKDELTINEHAQINQFLQSEAGGQANIILGVGDDNSLDEEISITIIATGVLSRSVDPTTGEEEKKVHFLDSSPDDSKTVDDQSQIHNKEYENDNPNLTEADIKDANFSSENENEFYNDNNARFESKNDKIESNLNENIFDDESSLSEKNLKVAEERKKRLQKFHNLNFQNQIILKELEDEPAYKRQGLELDKIDHSSSVPNSKYYLDSSTESPEIKNNNSFLHDNVD
tara:strand:+ start:4829 stop:6982 length:2154 start_codon:yes stop_codon:yes gene_type:complete